MSNFPLKSSYSFIYRKSRIKISICVEDSFLANYVLFFLEIKLFFYLLFRKSRIKISGWVFGEGLIFC